MLSDELPEETRTAHAAAEVGRRSRASWTPREHPPRTAVRAGGRRRSAQSLTTSPRETAKSSRGRRVWPPGERTLAQPSGGLAAFNLLVDPRPLEEARTPSSVRRSDRGPGCASCSRGWPRYDATVRS